MNTPHRLWKSWLLCSLLLLSLAGAACAPAPCNQAGDCPSNLQCRLDGKLCQGPDRSQCNPGERRTCYDGPKGTYRVGTCRAGIQTCVAQNTWGPCQGQILPQKETCDRLDNDCDGTADEGLANCSSSPPCDISKGCCLDSDCSDKAQCVNGKCEPRKCQCFTNLDCSSGSICDKSCQCVPAGVCQKGEQKQCYTGPPITAAVGICKSGTSTCKKINGALAWGPCEGEVLPRKEIANGLDDDCDGAVDEDTGCPQGMTRACGSSVGACQQGTQTCQPGASGVPQWSACTGEIKPSVEVCDGKDNDCDGQTDESDPTVGKSCTIAGLKGPCAKGRSECMSGRLTCQQLELPSKEICDGIDNDCNGKVDDADQSCTGKCAPTGLCQDARSQNCPQGYARATTPSSCITSQSVLGFCCNPTGPTCVLGESRPCYTGPPATKGVGPCKAGTQKCISGVAGVPQWGACTGEVIPKTEVCSGEDDDCDGTTDENSTCSPGQTRPCYRGPPNTKGIGVCKAGTQLCTATCYWSSCMGNVGPSAEIPNGLDDDCDGIVDEGITCVNGATMACGSNTGECKAGTRTCTNQRWGACVGEVTPKTEVCDGKDNDCDGQTDENLKCARLQVTLTILHRGGAVTKSVSPNDDLTYRIQIRNGGTAPAQMLQITEVLNLQYLERIIPSQGGYLVPGRLGVVRWDSSVYPALASLAVGATVQVDFKVLVKSSAPRTAPFSNTATVTSSNAPTTDSNTISLNIR